MPRHPEIRIHLRTANPYALVAAVREELRRAKVGRQEIREFSDEALSQADPLAVERVCRTWVDIETSAQAES